MQPEVVHAVGDLVADASTGIIGVIQRQHRAVAHRVFSSFGPLRPLVRPVEVIHNTIADTVYGGLSAVHDSAPRLMAAAAAPAVAALTVDTATSVAGNRLKGALNGAIGDHLAAHDSPLAVSTTVRSGNHDLMLTPSQVALAFPAARPRVGVFVHGLCGTDDTWYAGGSFPSPGPPHMSFGDALGIDLDLTPVYVRYNSGRPIAHSGTELSALLERLIDAWPVPVTDLVLVGHSMGGLVIRAAVQAAQASGAPGAAAAAAATGAGPQTSGSGPTSSSTGKTAADDDDGAWSRAATTTTATAEHETSEPALRWPSLVSRAAYLGTPHLGAPLEKAVNVLSWALSLIPETNAFGAALNVRSAGIKDLRFGTTSSQDWLGKDPDGLLTGIPQSRELLPGARHVAIGVSINADPAHPLGVLVGDGLVRRQSATGRTETVQRLRFEVADWLGGLHHLDLATHPAVYERLRTALKPADS